ncbi:DNA-directed RNA polymerase III subunit RPC5 [Chelonus insularis]|uniref:DNA-directed RNA polymerase III subunit RPC5 n=1 Tax=Chelonus insularis TaxID=460826 RepID=UPI00158C3FD7|nr:DNA-directed RNA polymerase III subunit RPC5 [Chelonus insularis]
MSSKMKENNDDPVIKEIPVFLSKNLAEKLFIFQYPIKPASKGYDNEKFLKSSIKPENQEVRIEVAIDHNSINYDKKKGQQIALNADGPIDKFEDDNENRIFESNIMDKTILQSSRAVPDCQHYSIGVYQDGELHITPLKSILQLKPQFDYLDDSSKTKEEAEKKNSHETEEEEVKQVNVKFARQKSEITKKKQEQSFQQHAKKISEEQWINTEYRNAQSSQAELTRLEMFCSSNETSANNLRLSCKEYLKLLAPVVKSDEHSKSNIPIHGTSLNYIRTLPLLDQVRIIMKDAKVMSFTQLRSIISSDHETGAILKYLQQVAVLVQGNWIVNSELLYPKDSTSSHSGISSELMCRARDYILLSFTENEFVDRKKISTVIKLPPEEIKEIFENLARHKQKKGWQLIIPPTPDFATRHPEIAQRQEMFWEAKRKHLKDVIETQNHPPQRQRRKSNRESIGSENEERNVGRGRKTLRDSSVSDESTGEPIKIKKSNRSRKVSENT